MELIFRLCVWRRPPAIKKAYGHFVHAYLEHFRNAVCTEYVSSGYVDEMTRPEWEIVWVCAAEEFSFFFFLLLAESG